MANDKKNQTATVTGTAAAAAAEATGQSAKPYALPMPAFRAVEYKPYEDRSNKAKTSGRLAYADVDVAGIRFSASIYLEVLVEQTASGRAEKKTLRFSLPKGIEIVSLDAAAVNAWKDSVLDAFIEWRKTTGQGSAAVTSARAGVRAVEGF